MRQLDAMYLAWKAGAIGEIDTTRDPALREKPSFYAKRNCWYGASFPGPQDVRGREVVGVDKILWGSDYPHYEGTYPHSRKAMRHALHDKPEPEVRAILGGNAAALYGFELAKLQGWADQYGPTPAEIAAPLAPDEFPKNTHTGAFMPLR
jgi:predicted TIM-barrel fold metal-dependent hydrolase